MGGVAGRAGLLLLSALFALGLAEAAVRVFGLARHEPRAKLIEPSPHPDLDYVLVPGARHGRGRRAVVINSLGMRDREFPIAKAPGTRRIVAIGDSITFGMRVRVEESYPKQLELRLSGELPPTEVLNLGVGGYDVWNEVALLEERGLRFRPDVVVLGLCINDVGVQSANLRFVERMRGWWWLANRSQLVRFVLQRLERRRLDGDLRLLNSDEEFARRNAGRIARLAEDDEQLARMSALASRLASRPAPLAYGKWYTSEPKIGRLRQAFARLAALSEAHGFAVWVVIVPFLDERGRPEVFRQVYEISAHEARRAGFRVILLRDVFVARGLEKLRAEPDDALHPNAEGHAIIADVLYDALRSAGG